MKDNSDDIKVLIYSYDTTITGWGAGSSKHVNVYTHMYACGYCICAYGTWRQ